MYGIGTAKLINAWVKMHLPEINRATPLSAFDAFRRIAVAKGFALVAASPLTLLPHSVSKYVIKPVSLASITSTAWLERR